MTLQPELRVVHALRLKGLAAVETVADAAGASGPMVERVLHDLAEAEFVRFRDGAVTGWMLTPTGRARGEELLADELDRAGCREALDELYSRFLELNQPFLRLCTEWQTRVIDGKHVVNDHADLEYDAAVVARLVRTDGDMQPLCADLGALLERFAGYGTRFAVAVDKVQRGETEWFTKPVIDSYHTVWFELHEDLLASLGLERSTEGRVNS